MTNSRRFSTLLLIGAALILVAVQPARAASFVVPSDREMVRQSTAVVVASALSSHTELNENNLIETVTTISVEDVLKGSVPADVFAIKEPGGEYEGRITTIPGVPRFRDGGRYVLFLIRTDHGVWRVLNLALGKFTFDTDILGRDVAVRALADVAAWDASGQPHREQYRSAPEFVDFIRATATGGPAREDYFVPAEPLIGNPAVARTLRPFTDGRRLTPERLGGFTATSYTYIFSGSSGARWNSFPSAVTFFTTAANAAANTAATNAIASWNGHAGSNINFVNGGADNSGTHSSGVAGADGQSTIAFERNLPALYGAIPFSCGGSSYGGTIGVGAVTNSAGTHSGPNGESFFTATEGDVEMNIGTSTCAFFIGLGDFNSAVAHELGHAIGFRHSDQTRASLGAPSCVGDPSLECTSSAIMTANVPSGLNGALQAWDQNAAGNVYPNAAINPPTNVVATATSATGVQVTWTAAIGATSYRVYRSTNGSTFSQVGTPAGSPFNDTASANTAYLYKVRSFNGAESGDSNVDLATTVIFTDSSLAGIAPKTVHITQLRTAVNAVRTLAGLGGGSYTDPTITAQSTLIKAAHITDLRAALNTARSTLALSAASYTDPTITAMSTLIKAVHVDDLRIGVR
jgi:hypothetical protein